MESTATPATVAVWPSGARWRERDRRKSWPSTRKGSHAPPTPNPVNPLSADRNLRRFRATAEAPRSLTGLVDDTAVFAEVRRGSSRRAEGEGAGRITVAVRSGTAGPSTGSPGSGPGTAYRSAGGGSGRARPGGARAVRRVPRRTPARPRRPGPAPPPPPGAPAPAGTAPHRPGRRAQRAQVGRADGVRPRGQGGPQPFLDRRRRDPRTGLVHRSPSRRRPRASNALLAVDLTAPRDSPSVAAISASVRCDQ